MNKEQRNYRDEFSTRPSDHIKPRCEPRVNPHRPINMVLTRIMQLINQKKIEPPSLSLFLFLSLIFLEKKQSHFLYTINSVAKAIIESL